MNRNINKIHHSRDDFLKCVSGLLPHDSTCVEIGVLVGNFSRQILTNLKPQKLFLVDPWKAEGEYYGGDL